MIQGVKQDDPQFKLRLPPALKERLEVAAADSRKTLTGEIVARLEASFQAAERSEKERRLEVATRENDVLFMMTRSQESTVRYHLEMLESKRQDAVRAGEKQLAWELTHKIDLAKEELEHLKRQLRQLLEEADRLLEQSRAAAKLANRGVDEEVERSLQRHYLDFHRRDEALGVPEELREVKVVKKAPAEPQASPAKPTRRARPEGKK